MAEWPANEPPPWSVFARVGCHVFSPCRCARSLFVLARRDRRFVIYCPMETTLPPILETKLADFRRRVWVVKLAEGALGAVFGIALSYLVVFGLDRFMETPAGLRWAILLTLAITLGLTLPLK